MQPPPHSHLLIPRVIGFICAIAATSLSAKADIIWQFDTKSDPKAAPTKAPKKKLTAKHIFKKIDDQRELSATSEAKQNSEAATGWNFEFSTSQKVVNLTGPNKEGSGALMISPLGGNLSLSGKEKKIAVGRRLGEYNLIFGLGEASASGDFFGSMQGTADASFEKLSFEVNAKAKQRNYSWGVDLPSLQTERVEVSEQYNLTKSKTDIEILNSNQIDWISLNNRASYSHEQYLLGHKLKNDLRLNEHSSIGVHSGFEFGFRERTNTGIRNDAFSIGLAYTHTLQPHTIGQISERPPSRRLGFVEFSGARGLATSNGITKLSEDDYEGNITFSDVLGMSGQDLSLRSSVGRCLNACWTVAYSKSKKKIDFGTENIANIFGPVNLSSSINGDLSVQSLGLHRHFESQKDGNLQSFGFVGANISSGNMRQTSSSSYKGRTKSSQSTRDLKFGGLTAGLGLRRYLNHSLYMFTEHSINYYDGNPFGVPLIINEAHFRSGIGRTF